MDEQAATKEKIVEHDFKPGDLVRLKSGGPLMTVESVIETSDPRRLVCIWFISPAMQSRRPGMKRYDFLHMTLERAEKRSSMQLSEGAGDDFRRYPPRERE
jgi:uncharacterized protein YodC (DUF2158 family)